MTTCKIIYFKNTEYALLCRLSGSFESYDETVHVGVGWPIGDCGQTASNDKIAIYLICEEMQKGFVSLSFIVVVQPPQCSEKPRVS